MPTKQQLIIRSKYTGIIENQELTYELILSKRLAYGNISVIVHNDLSVVIVANKQMNIEEINEIICVQYRKVVKEIERVKNK